MIGIIVITHQGLALRLIDAAERILGRQQNIFAVSLDSENSLQDFVEKISKAIDLCFKPSGSPASLEKLRKQGNRKDCLSLSLFCRL